MEGGFLPVHPVQLRHEKGNPLVLRDGELVPLEAVVVVPFLPLGEFAPHEQELLSGVGEHIAVEHAETGKLLPGVPGHLAQHGALAVDHLVMGEGKEEVLREGVHDAECDLVVAVLPVDRVLLHERKGVVHPPHVPLHAEPQTPDEDRAGDHGPRGGLLGDGLHVGEIAVDGLVQLLQKVDGLEVLPAAEPVGDPLPRLPGIVQVEHGCHGIHPQAVGVEPVEPEEGAAEQKAPHLVPAVVENPASPVWVVAFPGILVLVQACAVELRQAVTVRREVGGHPVKDHADTLLVQHVHHVHEILRCAVPAGGSEVAQGLVSPRAVEGVLHHGKQLHVGEPHGQGVVSQLVAELPVREGPEPFHGIPSP